MAAQRTGWRYRADVAARVLAATAGAYAVGAAAAMALARLIPGDPIGAAVVGTLAGYLVMAGTAIWAFLTRGPVRAVAGVAIAATVLLAVARLAGAPL